MVEEKYNGELNSNPSARGRLAEKIAQKYLWQRNYRVRDVSRIHKFGCDLLVNDTFRVEIKSMCDEETSFQLRPDSFDVLCVVYLHPLGNRIFFLKDKKNLKKMAKQNTYEIYSVNVFTLRDLFTVKPKGIFQT